MVTLLPCPYRGEYLTLSSPESTKNIDNGISMQENLVWGRFCASRGTRILELFLRGVGKARQKSAVLVRSPISNKNVAQASLFLRSFEGQHLRVKIATFQNRHFAFPSL